MNRSIHYHGSRRGMSFFEFVGCMSAMIGGVVLGSMYLGVDIKSTTISVLEHAQIMSSEPAVVEAVADESGASAAASTPSSGAEAASDPALAAESATPQPAAVANGEQVSAIATPETVEAEDEDEAEAEVAPAAAPTLDELINLTDEQRKALTIAYWTALDQCMKDEIDNRLAGIKDSGNLQLFDYLSCRSEGHKAALDRINKLSMKGVDAHVSAYAEKARAWHEDGAKLFARALDLLTDAPTAQLSGPFAQSWQSAATQHRMEERLLVEKHQAVRSYLDHSEQLGTQPGAAVVGTQAAAAGQ